MVNTRSGSGVDQPVVLHQRRGSNINPNNAEQPGTAEPVEQPGATSTSASRDGTVPYYSDAVVDKHGPDYGQYASTDELSTTTTTTERSSPGLHESQTPYFLSLTSSF